MMVLYMIWSSTVLAEFATVFVYGSQLWFLCLSHHSPFDLCIRLDEYDEEYDEVERAKARSRPKMRMMKAKFIFH